MRDQWRPPQSCSERTGVAANPGRARSPFVHCNSLEPLFCCGDATNGLERDVELADRRWSQCLLLRDDARWRRSRGWIAMAASVLKRRALILACSALLRAPYFKGWGEQIAELLVDEQPLRQLVQECAKDAKVRAIMTDPRVPRQVKTMLTCLRIVQARVPGTDGYTRVCCNPRPPTPPADQVESQTSALHTGRRFPTIPLHTANVLEEFFPALRALQSKGRLLRG